MLCFESLSLLSSELLSRLGQAAGAEDTGQWDLSVAGRWFPSSPRPRSQGTSHIIVTLTLQAGRGNCVFDEFFNEAITVTDNKLLKSALNFTCTHNDLYQSSKCLCLGCVGQ